MQKAAWKSSSVPAANFFLKVNLSCCTACPKNSEKKLRKLEGVNDIAIDAKQGLVAVWGSVKPQTLVDKFAKWGKRAVVWSPQKEVPKPSSDDDMNSKQDQQFCCCHKEEYISSSAAGQMSNLSPDESIVWQHPDLQKKLIATPTTQMKSKKKKLIPRMLLLLSTLFTTGKLKPPAEKPAKRSKPSSKLPPLPAAAANFGFPNSNYHMPEHGAYYYPQYTGQFYYRPPFCARPPAPSPYSYYYSHHHPMHLQPPPPPMLPPSHGTFSSMPPSLEWNPMKHYTRYQDNYY